MQRLLNWILGRSARRASRRHRQRFPLLLEQLEHRVTPTTYTWAGGNAGDPNTWEEPKNWTGGTSYPQTTSDIAKFGPSVNNCNMTQAEDISQLQVNFALLLTLQANLTLENGGNLSAGGSAEVIANSAAITWTIKGGSFDWTDGSINIAGGDTKGTLSIDGGTFQFHTSSGGHGFGDNITLASLTNSKLILGNSDVVTLYKQPTITNSGTIQITTGAAPTAGIPKLLVNKGDPLVTITNNSTGTIQKDTSTGEYQIQDPISNNGDIFVWAGTLHITGADPGSSTWSIQSTFNVEVQQGCTLAVDYELFIQSGWFYTKGQGTANINGKVQVGDTTHLPSFYVGDNVTPQRVRCHCQRQLRLGKRRRLLSPRAKPVPRVRYLASKRTKRHDHQQRREHDGFRACHSRQRRISNDHRRDEDLAREWYQKWSV